MQGGKEVRVLSCEECIKACQNDPPCHECKNPKLYRSNLLAWDIWLKCNNYARGVSMVDVAPIQMDMVMRLVEMYDGSMEDFDKVMLIEEKALPLIREKSESENKSKGPVIPNDEFGKKRRR